MSKMKEILKETLSVYKDTLNYIKSFDGFSTKILLFLENRFLEEGICRYIRHNYNYQAFDEFFDIYYNSNPQPYLCNIPCRFYIETNDTAHQELIISFEQRIEFLEHLIKNYKF